MLLAWACCGACLSAQEPLADDEATTVALPAVPPIEPEPDEPEDLETPAPATDREGTGTGRGDSLIGAVGEDTSEGDSSFDARTLVFWAGVVAAALVGGFLIFWARGIAIALARKREYQAAQTDPHPSVEERFLSELATMQVALLRSSAEGFYEKAYAMLCQILKSRRLIDGPAGSSEETVAHLRSMGVDAAFLDCVESIAQRCDAVRFQNARPDTEAHARLIRDLGTLIRMRPTAGVRRAERKGGMLRRSSGSAATPPPPDSGETPGQ